MSMITFEATLVEINGQTILQLPKKASKALPSRGQVAVKGTLNGHEFLTVLEPDGRLGHWMHIDRNLQRTIGFGAGNKATLAIEVTKDWPEPAIPKDFAVSLSTAPPKVRAKWQDITPMARWEWIRWVNETKSPITRTVRIEKSISKLNGKHRRPCCFNLAACTDPALSKNGQLMEPA